MHSTASVAPPLRWSNMYPSPCPHRQTSAWHSLHGPMKLRGMIPQRMHMQTTLDRSGPVRSGPDQTESVSAQIGVIGGRDKPESGAYTVRPALLAPEA